MKQNEYSAFRYFITGRVQGVGFRPYIYRMAHELNLNGYVLNSSEGVIVHIEGKPSACTAFEDSLIPGAPQGSVIKNIHCEPVEPENYPSFKIRISKEGTEPLTEISPDMAICHDCLNELFTYSRRQNYPLINCTNCGPRFTIVEGLPYDRTNTTMNEFIMCENCRAEYTDPLNRRFHAQPVSCHDCGPLYTYLKGNNIINDFNIVLNTVCNEINKGHIVAVKGLGGYFLACDAHNSTAVAELRRFKIREKKPFAVMFRSLESIRQYVPVSETEAASLNSWRKPIVILNNLKNNRIDAQITSGLDSVGAMLPYLPLHYLIFDNITTDALVLTSGNISDVPILYTEDKAFKAFGKISGGILMNNRKISRRADDSVVKIIDDFEFIMRRARGYAPSPVDLSFDADGILATGAELSNCFCLGKSKQAILSQHIGDLKNADTYEFFRENIGEFSRIFNFNATKTACDLHPDYLSTGYVLKTNIPCIRVQHHHAHTAAVMAEYDISEKIIGVSYDGTGLGTDGHIWGSEVIYADYNSFDRISHFEYVPLPGGDMVTSEPWRSGLSYLYHVYGTNWYKTEIPFIAKVDKQKAGKLIEAMAKGINSPLCCSAGRLFDAVASIVGICLESNYHAEAPMLLENITDPSVSGSYNFSKDTVVSFNVMIRQIVADLKEKKSIAEISGKFHNTIAEAALQQVLLASEKTGSNKVALSGGSFQNRYLTEKLLHLLHDKGFEVYYPKQVPCNDGGLALGQLAIAAHTKTE